MKIKFGTSGWRGIIADDFTFENVKLVTQSIANYLKFKKLNKRSVIIGYDARFLSEEFAKISAGVLAANSIKTMITNRPTPTPTISYEIIKKKLAGGINFTASHNPPEYNGLKFSPETGGPAMPEVTNYIEKECEKLLKNRKLVKYISFEEAEKKKLTRIYDPSKSYINKIEKLIDFDAIRKSKIRVIYDPMYGAGIGYMEKLFEKYKVNYAVIHNWRDSYFGGNPPEPAEEYITEVIKRVKKKEFDIGLGTDGDADRFGIVDSDGTFISPNYVLSLLAIHLYTYKKFRGTIVRTLATTHMLDEIARCFNLPLKVTPVGFKYLGDIMTKEKVLICGEESGGLSIYGHIPEKDGILACLLMLELRCVTKKTFKQLLKEAYAKFGKFISKRVNVRINENLKEKIKKNVESFKPVKLCGKKVVEINKTDGTKFILEDGSWLMVRFSGTEPVVRLYVEVKNEKELNKYISAGKKLLR